MFVFAFGAETRDTSYNRDLAYLEDNAGLVSASLGSARLLALSRQRWTHRAKQPRLAWSACLVAVWNTSRTPSPVLAEHST